MQVDVALIGADTTVGAVRAAIGELLSREGVAITWSRPERFRPEELLAGRAGGQRAAVAIWIDLSSPVEAWLYFRDALGQRFVVRRLAYLPIFGEIAVEEIAQIAKSVMLALDSGSEHSLSLSEARAALEDKAVRVSNRAPPLVPPPARFSPHPPIVELHSSIMGQAFAPQIPISERIELGVTALFGRTANHDHGLPGPFGAWIAAGYGLPAQSSGEAVSLDLWTLGLRAGLLCEPWRRGVWSIRFGLGAGVDRVTFESQADAPGVRSAPAGHFLTPMGSFLVGVGFDPTGRLSLALGAVVDVAGANVHYDFLEPNGVLTRVVVPFLFRPGLSFGAGWRL